MPFNKDKHALLGCGVIVLNEKGEVLVGKRKGAHAQFYSIPGGHIDKGESPAECAVREVREEAGIEIEKATVIGLSNDLETFKTEGVHYMSVIVLARHKSGEPKIMEPEKCEGWSWHDPRNLPEPHYNASKLDIQAYLDGEFYAEG